MNKCSVCGKSINRYSIETLKNGLRINKGFYTHKCPECGTYYSPSITALIIIIIALSYVEIPNIPPSLDNWWFYLLILIPFIILSVLYIVPLSVFWRIKKDAE